MFASHQPCIKQQSTTHTRIFKELLALKKKEKCFLEGWIEHNSPRREEKKKTWTSATIQMNVDAMCCEKCQVACTVDKVNMESGRATKAWDDGSLYLHPPQTQLPFSVSPREIFTRTPYLLFPFCHSSWLQPDKGLFLARLVAAVYLINQGQQGTETVTHKPSCINTHRYLSLHLHSLMHFTTRPVLSINSFIYLST